MKTVYLHGRLGKRFGKKWKLAVDNVQEAFSAIEVNSEGFFDYIIKSEAGGNEYIVLSKNPKFIKDENDLRENIIDEKLSKVNSKQTEIHILSPASGSSVVMPFLFVAGTVGSGLTTAGYIIASLAITYAVAALTKTPDEQKAKDPTSTKSYLISGGLTRQAQGIAVPLGYGRLKIGPANVATRKKSKKFLGYNPGRGSLLESYSELEFVDLICEGPIHGFVNQYGVTLKDYDILEGIYLNDTPVRNSAPLEGGLGDYNFILNEDQDKPRGRPVAKMGEDSDSKILSEGVFYVKDYDTLLLGPPPYQSSGKKGAKVLTHVVSNSAVNEITISLKTELSHQLMDGDDAGETRSIGLQFDILVLRDNKYYSILDEEKSGCTMITKSGDGLNFETQKLDNYSDRVFGISGIATSPYQFDINFKIDRSYDIENVSGGISFQVVRLTSEFDPSAKGGTYGGIGKVRRLQLAHVEEKISENLLYPHSAMVKLLVDSKNFSKVPDRKYDLKLKKVLIPENYDPISRKYEGPWNGLFKGQTDSSMSIHSIPDSSKYWTDNPAWVFFDLLYNTRYGVGKYGLEEENIDKWQLYKIAKYCDQLVETDYPVETDNGQPIAFTCTNILSNYDLSQLEIQIKIDEGSIQIPTPDPPSYDYSTYEVINGNYTYSQAKADAISRGGRLAIIRNSQENARMIDAYNSGIEKGGYRFYRAWIGLEQDGSDNSSWTWSDGSSLTYTNWGGNNPNNDWETRGLIGWDGKHRTTWNDAQSSTVASYILEKEGVDLNNPTPTLLELTREKFISLFGQGDLYKGKKVAFFISSGTDSISEELLIDQSVNREGKINIEERVLISSNPDNLSLTVSGPKIQDNQGLFNSVVGACAVQFNHPVVEPRFSANLFLTDRSEALGMITSLASIFRGISAYSSGKILAIQDSEKNPVQLFNNSNVSKEGFSYVGVQKNKRITASLVRFNNAAKNYQPDLVYEEDAEAIQKFGYIENEAMALGTTSESQARRFAKWILVTSQFETETIVFTAGQEASYLFPGCIFEVSDELRTGKTKSGRVLDIKSSRTIKINEIQYIHNDPYILLDKSIQDDPILSRVEITICAGVANSTLENLESRARSEGSQEDQDEEIESLFTPQIYKFDALLQQGGNIKKGPKGQRTIACELLLKIPLEVDLAKNRIKRYNHNFDVGEKIIFKSEGVLPGGLSQDDIYFVVNKTKNTFQISLDDPSSVSQYQVVHIFDQGRDFLGADGGDHYFCPFSVIGVNNAKTREALDQISIGSSYSIKGLIGASSKEGLSYQSLIQNLEIEGSLTNGWGVSSIFGYINIENNDGWVYSVQLNEWVFLKHKIENNSGWFYLDSLGWIFLKSNGDNYLWYISALDEWVHSEKYSNKFYRFQQSTSGISTGDSIKIKDKTIFIENVFSSHGYFFSFIEDSLGIIPTNPSSSFNTTISEINPGLKSSNISDVISIDSTESIQGQEAIRIVLNSGHGLDLRNTSVVSISGFSSNNSSLNSELNKENISCIFINLNTIELISSRDGALLLNSSTISSKGDLSFTVSAKSEIERMLESQLFRVISIKEIQMGKYEVSGLTYNSSKFNVVDKKGSVRKPHLPIPPQADMNIPDAPTALSLNDLTI
jgi:predicted phage tail protein